MEIYKVGGYVRDYFMGVDSSDVDYVVVGSNHQEMISLGYNQVGKDFPVYLDKDQNEYALARKERKEGSGYVGFAFETEQVSLKEDLERRDFTINSIAMDADNKVYDYFNGVKDIGNKIIRHTSNAFAEDPVRVLRAARFIARWGDEWTIAQETKDVIFKMSKTGVLNELQKDRIWKELSRALLEPHAHLFFRTLLECDVLHVIFPDIYKLVSATESYQWHPEGNAFEHTMLVVKQASKMKLDINGMFSALVHDIGKGLTPIDKLPRHYGHDVNGANYLDDFCDKYAVPSKTKKISKFVTRHHMKMHDLLKLKPSTIAEMIRSCGADKESLTTLIQIGMCDERGRKGCDVNSVDHVLILEDMIEAYNKVKFDDFPHLKNEKDGEKIKNCLFNARVKKISEVKKKLLTLKESCSM